MKLLKVLGAGSGVVMLNNAATTPPFEMTLKEVDTYLKTYGALHRGAGPNADKTYAQVQEGIESIKTFLHMRDDQAVLFTQNTSAAINLFIRLLSLKRSDVIITSQIEHTSNNLPWIYNSCAQVIEVKAFDDGSLDMQDIETQIEKYSKELKLVAITGASNLSGFIQDIKRIARLTHAQGARLFVDAAQLAPHRPIDMKRDGIDALAFSAHKVYAPFGLGVLVLPKTILDCEPVDPGGGSIDMISEKEIVWAPTLHRHQTGTWNVTGIVALGASCREILKMGWKEILGHERALVKYMATQLATIPELMMYVDPQKFIDEDRIGTFTFNLPPYHHALLSAILDKEYGIETRAGTICNHRLVRRWFKMTDKEQKKIEAKIRNGNRLASYGIVRASLGIHNTKKDIDALVKALKSIAKNGPRLKYRAVPFEEVFIPTSSKSP